MSAISLQSLMTPQKFVEVEFPGYEGFKLKLAALSREEIIKLRKKCIVSKFNKQTRRPEDEFDGDLFLKLYVEATIKGWSGFKLRYVELLMLVDLSAHPDLDLELEFTPENALALMKNSTEVDNFVTDVTNDLTNFTTSSSKS